MILQNTIVQFVSIFIPNQELRHKFRNRFKRKTKFRILRDENTLLRQEINFLKHECRRMQNEYKYLNYRYAMPEQRPQMLKDWYSERMGGGNLDLENPRTFNEKLQWLKLYDKNELKTRLADKYEVRGWVRDKIGDEYLIPLLGVYDTTEEINWDELPIEFVIKCNHGSGMNIVVNDKNTIDRNEIYTRLKKWLSTTYGISGFELHYYKIKPKVIIEKKMVNEGTNELYDYKFYCFGGDPKYIQFGHDRENGGVKFATYNTNWERQEFAYNHPMTSKIIERPNNLDLMMSIAKKLSLGFKFVRVDLYRLNDGTIFFGEMTFFPANGIGKWYGQDMSVHFGNLIEI